MDNEEKEHTERVSKIEAFKRDRWRIVFASNSTRDISRSFWRLLK